MTSEIGTRRFPFVLTHVLLAALAIPAFSSTAHEPGREYPISPYEACGSTRGCFDVMDAWNANAWRDVVDDTFSTGPTPLAAVRWYNTEATPTLTPDAACPVLDQPAHKYCGVTDELSNVLLAHAMGRDRARFEKLRNFTELLRHPSANGLQCYKWAINGSNAYTSYSQVCASTDSASDASLRILGAYGIACAKRDRGEWAGGVDYCADYRRQADAILGRGTPSHGEIKVLPNGQYYLANGYNNQTGSPTNGDAFRPDYYELQFLADLARYESNPALLQGVVDMLEDYWVSTGTNRIHRGKTGHFDATTTAYSCDQLCSPPYMDSIDTWRAIPAISGLRLVHPSVVPALRVTSLFDYWWTNYSGGHPTLFGPSAPKPAEIFSNAADGIVKGSPEESYKTLGMWIPLASAYSAPYARTAVAFLVDAKYDWTNGRFYGSGYHAAYSTQFAHRALGAATGLIDPAWWRAARTNLYTVTPCRLFDTRDPDGPSGGPAITLSQPRAFPLKGRCGIPPEATAVVANITVDHPTAAGSVGLEALVGGDTLASIRFSAGQTRATSVLVRLPVAASGEVLFRSQGAGSTQLILDVTGYFR